MRSRSFAVTSLVLCAGLLGGCGGSGEDEQASAYADAVNAAQMRFSTSIDRTAAERSTLTAATAKRWGSAVDRMARELRAIDAPDRVEPLHGRLVAEVGDFRSALRRALGALRSGDRAEILAARSRLVASARRATREIEATLRGIDRTLRS